MMLNNKWLPVCLLVLLLTTALWPPRSGLAGNLSEDEQLVRVGTGAYRDGFYDIAEAQFSHFLKSYPNHARFYDVCYLLGKTLLAKGNLREAGTFFSRIIAEDKSFEDMAYALFWAAVVETRLGNAEEARKLLITLIRRYPKFEWSDYSHYLLGLIEFGGNRLHTAEASLKIASSSSRKEELVRSSLFWLGVIAYRKKDFEASIRFLREIGRNPKSLPQEYVSDALFWLAEAQVKLIRFQEARGNYETYYDQFKDNSYAPEILWRLAYCEYRLGNIPRALEIFQTVKTRYRDSKAAVYAHYLSGEIFLRQADFSSCLREFNFILNHSQAQAFWGTALITQYWCLMQSGENDEANKVFQKLFKLNSFEEEKAFLQWVNAEVSFSEGKVSDFLPYYFNIMNTRFRERALFQIGRGYFFDHKFREAITNLDILSLEFPNSKYGEEGLFIKGESYLHLGNVDQALETFSLMTRQNRTSPWRLFALTETGSIQLLRHQTDSAEKAFKAVTAEFANHPLSYYAAFQLGNVEFQKTRMAEATSYYSAVLKGNILDLLGEVYFRFGEIFYGQEKYENAFRNFERALQYFKENSLGSFLTQMEIGNIQRRWDKLDDAKRSYQNIVDHSKDEDLRNAARELITLLNPPS